jgi:hypothetical protein
MYPFKFERLKEPRSLISMNVVLFILDAGKDRDNSDVDENVRTAITVSALRHKLPLQKYEVVLPKFDKGDEEI